jgi:hypothetical protein
VKTKSKLGLPGLENSAQSLLRSPSIDIRFFLITSTANGFRLPFGWLPAEKALNGAPAMLFKIASAIIDRPELLVQIKSTLNFFAKTMMDPP